MARLLTTKQVEKVKEIEAQIELLKKQQQKYKQTILKKMQNSGIKSFEIDGVSFRIKGSFERTDLDKKKLGIDFPDLVKKYSKTSIVKETLLIKI